MSEVILYNYFLNENYNYNFHTSEYTVVEIDEDVHAKGLCAFEELGVRAGDKSITAIFVYENKLYLLLNGSKYNLTDTEIFMKKEVTKKRDVAKYILMDGEKELFSFFFDHPALATSHPEDEIIFEYIVKHTKELIWKNIALNHWNNIERKFAYLEKLDKRPAEVLRGKEKK